MNDLRIISANLRKINISLLLSHNFTLPRLYTSLNNKRKSPSFHLILKTVSPVSVGRFLRGMRVYVFWRKELSMPPSCTYIVYKIVTLYEC